MSKRARPHFRLERSGDGTPFIVMERRDGDDLELFRRRITFDLPKNVSHEDAQSICDYLGNHLTDIGEA